MVHGNLLPVLRQQCAFSFEAAISEIGRVVFRFLTLSQFLQRSEVKKKRERNRGDRDERHSDEAVSLRKKGQHGY